MLLVPADPLHPRRADEHFADEARSARDTGLPVALVDHDTLTSDGADADRALAGLVVAGSGSAAVYRGWMLRSGQYAAFAEALTHRGVALCTTAEQYRQAHELPGWYPALAAVTPPSVWTTGADRDGFDHACRQLGSGPAVLRDYTKSMKHYWHEAVYIPDVADTDAAWTVADRFRQLRDDEFTGGYVLRRFERFGSAEVRTWWVHGTCRLVGPHPDTPQDHPPADLDLSAVTPLVAALRLPFVTVDLARRADGAWRVIELGDGQVSDRPATVEPQRLTALITDIVRSPPS
jgi:ATP-grasp domain-containing protein